MLTMLTLPPSYASPAHLTLAADARFSRVDYADDQAWEVAPGKLTEPALALHTRYGARVGLASLVPMWSFPDEHRAVYQAQAYAQPPQISAFAPGYARLNAALSPSLNLITDLWTMESHALGVRYTLHNHAAHRVKLHLDVIAQVGAQGKALKLAVVTLANSTHALSFGALGSLHPIVMLEGGTAPLVAGRAASPKIGVEVNLAAGETVTLRWVHAALNDLRDSLALAEAWLKQDWDAHIQRIEAHSASLPIIETGNPAYDAAIALSVHHLVQAVMKGNSLPHPSLVATRQPASSFSPAGDGSDHDRSWSGQTAHLAYFTAPTLATLNPELAFGLIRNFLAVQTPDGTIDGKPGLNGQRQATLAVPILARLTLELYHITGNITFVREALPKLSAFLGRWLRPSGSKLPTWEDERQTGYVYFPTFGAGQPWAQNADIRYVESPDLAAYLVSEAHSLRQLAQISSDETLKTQAEAHLAALTKHLDALWHAESGRYTYRDRDTGFTQAAQPLISEARPDEPILLAQDLTPAARVLIRITGGTAKTPKLRLSLHGKLPDGKFTSESIDFQGIGWYRGYGVYVSQQVYTFVDRIEVEGLSRVYKVDVQTVDTTRLDMNALLPLWTETLSAERAASLVKLITDGQHFAQSSGLSMTPASDPTYDPTNAQGGGGVWLFWTALIGEGLLKHGYAAESVALLQRVLTMLGAVLSKDGRFHEFYHAHQPIGSGETGHLMGSVPLGWLSQTIGAVIPSPSQVVIRGACAWAQPITLKQHGVSVTRSLSGTRITFASGQTVELPPDAPRQTVHDPQPAPTPAPMAVLSPPAEPHTQQPTSAKVVIQVQIEPS